MPSAGNGAKEQDRKRGTEAMSSTRMRVRSSPKDQRYEMFWFSLLSMRSLPARELRLRFMW